MLLYQIVANTIHGKIQESYIKKQILNNIFNMKRRI